MATLNAEFERIGDPLWEAIDTYYRIDETVCVENILSQAAIDPAMMETIQAKAAALVKQLREARLSRKGIDAFMFQYDLSSEEGVALMCLAEALLRIPDKETVDKLIRDKLALGNWRSHLGKSHSFFVNAATWGLMLTGKMLQTPEEKTFTDTFRRFINKGGEPIARQAILHAMKVLGRQFVMGSTIEEALDRAKEQEKRGYRYSYDMLGEAAYTAQDAQKYLEAYERSIAFVAKASVGRGPIEGPGISVKLSALHPRFILAQKKRLHEELMPRLKALVIAARDANIGLTIDAEEAHTLMLSLELIQGIIESNILGEWEGFGLAVQAYQKRAPFVLDYLIDLARRKNKRLMIRLVKGAYWDTEIKLTQVQGLSGYPVFTRKNATDVNYIACVKKMLSATDVIYPQFATHNALTLATVASLAKEKGITQFEFQCLHGMGDTLYDQIAESKTDKMPCRIYAPVGTQEELLAYLVRRLLENGANSSFVNRISDEKLPIEAIVADPVETLEGLDKPHPKIPLPRNLFLPDRENSIGLDLNRPSEFLPVLEKVENLFGKEYQVSLGSEKSESIKRYSPIHRRYLGTLDLVSASSVNKALEKAAHAFKQWKCSPSERAQLLEKMATLLQRDQVELLSLLIEEGGKTVEDAAGELREAIDFCTYYAFQIKQLFVEPQTLKGPTGELNQLSLHGRGIIACISPWNFPLAIFLGQVTAGLAAGNCVIAKPASQTVFIADKALALLHEAGFPPEVVQLLPGKGAVVGDILVSDLRVKGILFTGSTETARDINKKLAARAGGIIPFIAETGGQNAMIVDSSALAEQVTQDVITSAFRSAGQRCSALRVLFIQEEIADKVLTMLKGAMAELQIGHPGALSTDVGPVIDGAAQSNLEAHVAKMENEGKGKLLYAMDLPAHCEGTFFAPRLYEISHLNILTEEVFGPILHVIRFKQDRLNEVIEQINQTGFGLTLGIHSRINETIDTICKGVNVGNIYVNRNMIGAVVGVQPFGGEGLSGTGPKAGGPYYLPRLATERTLSVNTTAAGGNTSLMSLFES